MCKLSSCLVDKSRRLNPRFPPRAQVASNTVRGGCVAFRWPSLPVARDRDVDFPRSARNPCCIAGATASSLSSSRGRCACALCARIFRRRKRNNRQRDKEDPQPHLSFFKDPIRDFRESSGGRAYPPNRGTSARARRSLPDLAAFGPSCALASSACRAATPRPNRRCPRSCWALGRGRSCRGWVRIADQYRSS